METTEIIAVTGRQQRLPALYTLMPTVCAMTHWACLDWEDHIKIEQHTPLVSLFIIISIKEIELDLCKLGFCIKDQLIKAIYHIYNLREIKRCIYSRGQAKSTNPVSRLPGNIWAIFFQNLAQIEEIRRKTHLRSFSHEPFKSAKLWPKSMTF